MYEILKWIQLAIVIMCIIFVAVVSLQRGNQLSKLMLCCAFLATLQSSAYLVELSAFNYESMVTALCFKYLGAAFIGTFFMVFCAKYCERYIPKWIQWLLFIWDFAVVIAVWTWRMHRLYFADIIMVSDSSIPHLVVEQGPMCKMNVYVTTIEMAVCIIMAFRGWHAGKNRRFRNNCRILLISSSFPLFMIPTRFLEAFDGYDSSSVSVALCIVGFFQAVMVQKIMDVSEIAHKNIIQATKEPIIIVDSEDNFLECNAAAEELFPWLTTFKMGEPFPDNRIFHDYSNGNEGEILVGTRTLRYRTESIFDNELLIGYSIHFLDLTNERQQLQEMSDLKNEAERANQAKTEFLTKISHEIRTPINAVMGMNEMILRESREMDIKRYSLDIKNAAYTLLSLINELLDASKIESGKMEIIPGEYSVMELFRDLYNMTNIKAKSKNLQLKFIIDPELPSRVYGDDVRIRQVLINVLTNAVKYTENGEVTLRATGERNEDGVSILFEVEDTGIGIKEHELHRLFAKFERVDLERNRYVEGTGLGLNIAAQMLSMMNSQLRVESTYGQGSRFYFTLRQEVVDETPIGDFYDSMLTEIETEQYVTTFVAPNVRLLVVDDNAMNIKVFRNLLKPTGMEIDDAISGEMCLKLCRENKYDIIFMDHMMPVMDGIETFHAMKQDKEGLNFDTPVIMLTANAVIGAKTQFIEEGFSDFISKPVDCGALDKVLLTYLPDDKVEHGEMLIGHKGEKKTLKELPNLEEFDLEYAMGVLEDEDTLKELLIDFYHFLGICSESLELLEDKLEADDNLIQYRVEVHSLKSSAATVGAMIVSKLARVLEIAAKEENIEKIHRLHPILIEEMQLHQQRIEVLLPKEEHKIPVKNLKEVTPLFEMLHSSLKAGNINTADYLLKEINHYEFDNHLWKQMKELSNQILSLEVDEAIETVENILHYSKGEEA